MATPSQTTLDDTAAGFDLTATIGLLEIDADEDLVLTLPYVAPGDQPRVAALYGLALTLRAIPDVVSEAPIGEIRLQWQRDALDKTIEGTPPKGHPLYEALARAGVLTPAVRGLAEKGIDARARFLYAEPFPSVDDLFETLCAAEGWLAAALFHIAASNGASDATGSQPMETALMRLGGAYALARWGRQARPALAGAFPENVLNEKWNEAAAAVRAAAHGGRFEALRAPLLYLNLAKGYAARAPGAPWPVMKRLTLFRAMAAGALV